MTIELPPSLRDSLERQGKLSMVLEGAGGEVVDPVDVDSDPDHVDAEVSGARCGAIREALRDGLTPEGVVRVSSLPIGVEHVLRHGNGRCDCPTDVEPHVVAASEWVDPGT